MCKLDQKENTFYCFLFLQVLECFTSLGALLTYVRSLIREGFPHSEILGYNGCLAPYRGVSPPYCVLHRFLEPRHPPYALIIPVRNNDNHNVSSIYFYCAILHCACTVANVRRPKRPHCIGILNYANATMRLFTLHHHPLIIGTMCVNTCVI